MAGSLIPRKLLFGNPERTSVRISPDGAHLAWLAPRDGVLNVWVALRDNVDAAKPVTHDTVRGIRMFTWAHTSRHILHLQDKGGDENWRIYVTNLDGGETRDLTPIDGIQARIEQLSRYTPTRILVGLNDRDPRYHDIHLLDIESGERELVCENTQFAGIMTDEHFAVREASIATDDGGVAVYRPIGDGPRFQWKQTETIPQEDALTTDTIGFDESGKTAFVVDSRGRNTSALFAVDWESGERRLLAEDERADVSSVVRHPATRQVQAVSFVYQRTEWKIIDPAIQVHLDRLASASRGEIEIVSRTMDDRFWIVAYELDNASAQYYLYDTSAHAATKLFSAQPKLDEQPLVPMHSATIKTSDGMDMVVYWTLPPGTDSDDDGIPDAPLPFVLYPHGGPWARSSWGYSPIQQWLSNRGYATMALNFRSSTGFGKAHINAGDREWGGRIIDDQADAVGWAKKKGIADLEKVGIMGGSFGGYSTLAGLTMKPEIYAAGVDIVGPSNLRTLLESVPEYWKPMLNVMRSRIADETTDEGRALLEKHSPLTYVDRIRSPLLIGQGANDPRVKQAESDQIVTAMQEKGIPVAYVLYPDEGHGFARPENRLSFFAVAEAFLAKHLGGRAEPVGDDFENSSIEVRVGREELPGLPEA